MSVLAPNRAYQQGLDCPLFAPLRREPRTVRHDTATGEQNASDAKQKGFTGAQLAADAAGEEWTQAAYTEARRLIVHKGWLIAEHVWEALRAKGMDTDHPNAMGAVLARLGRDKVAVNTGMTKATGLARSHGRPQAIWARPGVMIAQVQQWAGLV